jgi:hypothetical protein
MLTIGKRYLQKYTHQQHNVLRIRSFSSNCIRPCAARPSRHHIRRTRARHGTPRNGTWHDGRRSPRPADEEFWGHVWWQAKNGRRGHDGRAARGWVSLLGVSKTRTYKIPTGAEATRFHVPIDAADIRERKESQWQHKTGRDMPMRSTLRGTDEAASPHARSKHHGPQGGQARRPSKPTETHRRLD